MKKLVSNRLLVTKKRELLFINLILSIKTFRKIETISKEDLKIFFKTFINLISLQKS